MSTFLQDKDETHQSRRGRRPQLNPFSPHSSALYFQPTTFIYLY